MTNTSILAAFERLWQHVLIALGNKSDSNHTHDDRYYTETEVDTKISSVNSSISNITNGTTKVANATHADSADSATTATSATKATQDGNGKVISSTYETKTDASSKLAEAKSYADTAASNVKNDLLNGAGTAYDTLKELGDLIVDNKDAIDALEDIASSKASATHTHGNITNAGAIGTTADKAVITTTNGVLTTGTVPITSGGTGATTAAAALTNLGLTATAAELNKMDGVTATTAELNYVDGVTSNIQTQLDSKQATVTGAATTITGSNLTASRALVSNSSGKVAVSAVTSTELGYLDGVTSAIQTQLDAKAAQSSLTSHTGNTTIHITDDERTAWNAKSNFSGNYNDLTNKPTIPSISGLATETYVNDLADSKVDKVSGKGLSTNDYTTTEKTKLSGIATGAEVNQNAFSNVVVGSTTIAADSKTDSLTIAAGTGISVSGDATNDKVTITNSGVRSISTGGSNGTISVNTNGSSTEIAVKGLGSAAYTASTAYDAAGTAQTKSDEALESAKSYTDGIKNDLLNNINGNKDAIDELEDTIAEKAKVTIKTWTTSDMV